MVLFLFVAFLLMQADMLVQVLNYTLQLLIQLLLTTFSYRYQFPVHDFLCFRPELFYLFRFFLPEQLPHSKFPHIFLFRTKKRRCFCACRHGAIISDLVKALNSNCTKIPSHSFIRVPHFVFLPETKIQRIVLFILLFCTLHVIGQKYCVLTISKSDRLQFAKVIRLIAVFIWKNDSTVVHLNETQLEADVSNGRNRICLIGQEPDEYIALGFGTEYYLHLDRILDADACRVFVVIQCNQTESGFNFVANDSPHVGRYAYPFHILMGLR